MNDQILKQNKKDMGRDIVSFERTRPKRTKSITSKCSVDPYGKMSVHSRVSTAPTTPDRATVFKTFCRSLVQFMFTQVGVGGLVVCYTVCGAITFQAIETTEEPAGDFVQEVETYK